MNVTPEKVTELELKIDKLDTKVDAMSIAIQGIQNTLSKTDGVGMPSRIAKLEEQCRASDLHQASVQWIPEEVKSLREDVDSLSNWRYTVIGGFILLGVIIPIVTKLL